MLMNNKMAARFEWLRLPCRFLLSIEDILFNKSTCASLRMEFKVKTETKEKARENIGLCMCRLVDPN